MTLEQIERRLKKIEILLGIEPPPFELHRAIQAWRRGDSALLNQMYGKHSIEQSQEKYGKHSINISKRRIRRENHKQI